jgi:hypothetical protein
MTSIYDHHVPAEVRFWSRVAKRPDGCWVWTGKTTAPGWHGQLMVNHKRVLAHRYSWELHKGPIPPGVKVRHKCDNPPCVNPEHLLLGSQRDNMQDCVQRGRMNRPQKFQTHCKHGHAYTPENTYRGPKTGRRQCLVCRYAALARMRERRSGAPTVAHIVAHQVDK